MFSKFFIDRPIFASVLSIVITLGGGIAVFTLPVTQYPDITPPTVEVSTVFPGANAEDVVKTVASPIEERVNGVEDMLYMSSQSANDGSYTLTVTFRPGTDLNLAQVLVQNRVNLAQPVLPDLVKRRGVTVKKKSPSVLMIINLYSPKQTRDNLYLSNYATIQLRDELSRLSGVGDIVFLGQRDYSMRVWLDPDQLAVRNLTAADVIRAIEQQNIQVAAGQVGQPPVAKGQIFQYTMSTLGRLSDAKQFDNIIIRSLPDGRIIRLKDVAETQLGALAYDQVCTLDQQPSVAMSIYQLPGSNALDTANQVRQKMAELETRFPDDVKYQIVYDTTPFITESIREVFISLRDAVVLVAIVVLVFLQGWRAAIIPLVAVPVAIVGTFAAMAAVGFSLNTLTLFGLVLAVGIVVDDAIVVVEAIEHHIERGLSPRDAALKAMSQVSGPVIAVGLVLSAVFVPCAFITGIVGQFFRQFAITIAISTVISAFNSLTLSPALAVLLLRPKEHGQGESLPKLAFALAGAWLAYTFAVPWLGPALQQANILPSPLAGTILLSVVGAVLGWLVVAPLNIFLFVGFRAFNRAFWRLTEAYAGLVGLMLRASLLVLAAYGGLIFATSYVFQTTPVGFIPPQDKGYLLVNVQLPDTSSLERTEKVIRRIEAAVDTIPGVNHTVAIAGQSILLGAAAPNVASMYVMLDEFHDRTPRGLSADVIAGKLADVIDREVEDGTVNILGAPPIEGLGTAGGFKLVVTDRGDHGLKELQSLSEAVVTTAQSTPGLTDAFTSFRANSTWLKLELDRTAALATGVSLGEVFGSLQANFGSFYVNDLNRFGRTWQVNVQANAKFRTKIEDLKRLRVHTSGDKMAPLAAFMEVKETGGPVMLFRYNMYPAAFVNANAAPGTSSGEAIERLWNVAEETMIPGVRPQWTELAFLQLDTGNTAMYAFILAVMLVFLVLAAQYESWSLPLAVILVVPMCLLCSLVGVRIAGMDINIFTQVGFVVLVGLACKNAILIVEFARARRAANVPRRTAILDACRLRLRPIVMTSFAFIFGVIPLMIGQGAGAEMRRTLGTAVFGGMLGVTLFGIFLTPVFFNVIQWFVDWRAARRRPADDGDDAAELEAEIAGTS